MHASKPPGTRENPWVNWEDELRSQPVMKLRAGWYKLTKRLDLFPRSHYELTGEGQGATHIIVDDKFSGTAIRMAGKINTNTDAYLRLADFTLANEGLSTTTDAGIELIALVSVNLERVTVNNFRIGLVLDQTNRVKVDGCDLANGGGNGVGTIGLWVVNGYGRNPKAQPGFTNIVTVRDTFFNASYTEHTHVRDDGGYSHHYDGCFLNGGGKGFYLAGVQSGSITRSYVEGLTDTPITLEARWLGGEEIYARCNGINISDNFSYGNQPQINLGISNWSTIARNCFVGHPKCAIVSPYNDSAGNTIEPNNIVQEGTALMDENVKTLPEMKVD